MSEVIDGTAAKLGEDSQKSRRGMRWVDPEFQKRYSLFLISIVLLVSTALIFTFWFHSQQVLASLASAGFLKQHNLYAVVDKQLQSLLISVCVVVALFSGFVFVMAMFLSHRIVGPIYAIKRSLEYIGSGRLSEARVKLRTDDEFQEVGELINKTVDLLEKK